MQLLCCMRRNIYSSGMFQDLVINLHKQEAIIAELHHIKEDAVHFWGVHLEANYCMTIHACILWLCCQFQNL